jgi:hypothetical protein
MIKMKTEIGTILGNVQDFLNNGYTTSYTSYQRGYVTRKPRDMANIDVLQGRDGIYYLAPSFKSTIYCVRVYLKKY